MTLLPVADRELRTAARSSATQRWRILFALGGVLIAGILLTVANWIGAGGGWQPGLVLFDVLKWSAFIYACGAGIFLTADCLSEEKREGTLGLLFLTDLRGHDVILGKLAATSLRAFYSLLAVFPVMGLAFVMGGVTGGEFWRSILAVCNALFFSLALGMAVSVVSRHPHKSMTGAAVVLLVFIFVLGTFERAPLAQWLRLFAPDYAFRNAGSRGWDYWWSVLAVHLTAWGFLAWASALVARTWREGGWRERNKNPARLPRRARLLDTNPVAWLAARDRWAAMVARCAVLLIVAMLAVSVISALHNTGRAPLASSVPSFTYKSNRSSSHSSTVTTFTYSASARSLSTSIMFRLVTFCAGASSLALVFWLAIHVSRFYVEGRKSGTFELLLVTPLPAEEIVRGHWQAVRRLFLLPVLGQLALNAGLVIIQIVSLGTATGFPMPHFARDEAIGGALGVVSWTVSALAVVEFSIWMGMSSRKITTAVLQTICYVKILPWVGTYVVTMFVFLFCTTLTMTKGLGSGLPNWFSAIWLIGPQVLTIGIAIGLAKLARSRVPSAFVRWRNS